MYKFKKWTIEERYHCPVICGYIYDHPDFTPGYHIITSRVVNGSVIKEGLVLETYSGSQYLCDFKQHSGKTNDISLLTDFFGDEQITYIKKLINSASKRLFTKQKDFIVSIVPEDECIIISLNDTDYHFESILYHDGDNDFFTKHHYLHLGLYKNSVLIGYPEVDDFRFYTDEHEISFYKFSRQFGPVYIYNNAKEKIRVKSPNGEFIIRAGVLSHI